MMTDDNAPDTDRPPPPDCLVYRCRRCSAAVTEAHADPTVALRRMLESGQPLVTLHECDGVTSIADLIGTGTEAA